MTPEDVCRWWNQRLGVPDRAIDLIDRLQARELLNRAPHDLTTDDLDRYYDWLAARVETPTFKMLARYIDTWAAYDRSSSPGRKAIDKYNGRW